MKEELKNIHSDIEIMNFIRYCQGYIKLVNPSFSRFRVNSDAIDEKYLSTNLLYEIGEEEDTYEINLEEFYKYDPKKVPEEAKQEYEAQKELAQQLEEIKNRFKISEYTKQTNLNFGYFKVEIPEPEIDESEEDKESGRIKNKNNGIYPLFSLPVEIVADRKFSIKLQDNNITPNIGFLFDVLGEEKFYEFADFVNRLEVEGSLRLPVEKKTIENIWEELKSKLKLSKAVFDQDSFDSSFFVISLSGKSNYFLEQDFNSLLQLDEEEFEDTSLCSWNTDTELSIDEPINERDGELFFPFPYNKDQVGVLSAVKNRACIIEGPPGTGKSQTIANLLCHFAANGKKVLFLSQKAQAIKVVKDYLKKLDVQYLYGYIPNRFSSLYNSEEEKDSASMTLQSIELYLNSLEYNNNEFNVEESAKEKFRIQDVFNETIGLEREIFNKYEEKFVLDKFDIGAEDVEKFNGCSDEDINHLIKNNENIEKLRDEVDGYYRKKAKFVNKLNKQFGDIKIDNNLYSSTTESIISEIPQGAYERDGVIASIKNQLIKSRLKKFTDRFPKEVYSVFNEVLDKKSSRTEKIKELTEIKEYFDYRENTILLELKIVEENNNLATCGLTRKSFEKMLRISKQKDGLENIRRFALLTQDIEKIKLYNPNEVNDYLHKIRNDESKFIARYLQNIIINNLKEITKNATLKGILARIARSLQKSKRAYKTFDKFKNEETNFYVMREAVPIWIMDLEDVSRLIPLEKNLFDYVILDEASQCNIAYALPAMFRAQRAILVGDSEQMRDDSVRFKTNKSLEMLAKKFSVPDFLQIKAIGDSVQSIIDIGYKRGFMMKPLTYHYRSPKELIGFSNDYFYAPKGKKLKVVNNNYLTYKDTNRVLINHIVKPTKELDISGKSNIAEAKYICQLIEDLKKDPKTKDKSIGVLSFFANQATLLRNMIKDEDIKVSIIEGIQGDEKDIIIYSMVICDPSQKRMYIPLTGEGGEINKGLNEGRVNVAFSRARQQVHVVTSLPVEKWTDGIWIKRYLEYVQKNGEVDFFATELKPFDSKFEDDFYQEILRANFGKGFIIQNQVESCGYKIDFVVTDTENGRQLAIECDGPTHFVDENDEGVYVQSDFERQAILESAGWTFYRLNYGDWINKDFDREIIAKDIIKYFDNKTVKELIEEEDENINNTDAGDNFVTVDVDNDTEYMPKEELVTDNKKGPEPAEIDARPTINPIAERKLDKVKSKKRTQKKEYPEANGFDNILEFKIGSGRKLVVSLFNDSENLIINEYVERDSYTGYTQKNLVIATRDIGELIDKSKKVLEDSREESLPWKGSEKEKIIIKRIDKTTIDIRQYLYTSWYTGYTKKGLRLDTGVWSKFIDFTEKNLNKLK